ncbi:hypothetical protein LJR129_005074 [Acidovorax sp. LjRoot129]|uniref:hypothetical protein n=1 Tax=Acidovorax sp. LjRoot194 TaxID=3342280 RepID=UPI003ECD8772
MHVATSEVDSMCGGFTASADVLVHESRKFNERMVSDPNGIAIESINDTLHRLDGCIGALLIHDCYLVYRKFWMLNFKANVLAHMVLQV